MKDEQRPEEASELLNRAASLDESHLTKRWKGGTIRKDGLVSSSSHDWKKWEKRVGNRRVNEKEFSTTSILQLIMFQCIHYPSNTRAKGVRVKLSLVSTASGATFQLQDSAIHWAAKEKQLRKKEVQKHRTPIEGYSFNPNFLFTGSLV